MSNLKYLDGVRWRTRAEMAAFLGVSERTVTRRVNRGELVRRTQPSGNLYRLADARDSETGHGTGQDTAPSIPAQMQDDPHGVDTTRDTGHGTPRPELIEKLIDRLDARHARIVELTGELERTRAEIVTYQTHAHLERGRRELAEERLADALAELGRLRDALDRADQPDAKPARPWWTFGK